jgi:hypothetical protein
MHDIHNWSTPIDGFITSLRSHLHTSSSGPVELQFSSNLQGSSATTEWTMMAREPSREVQVLKHNISTLTRAFNEFHKSNISIACTNLELLAFALSWFSQVSTTWISQHIYSSNTLHRDILTFLHLQVDLARN